MARLNPSQNTLLKHRENCECLGLCCECYPKLNACLMVCLVVWHRIKAPFCRKGNKTTVIIVPLQSVARQHCRNICVQPFLHLLGAIGNAYSCNVCFMVDIRHSLQMNHLQLQTACLSAFTLTIMEMGKIYHFWQDLFFWEYKPFKQ